MTTISIFIIAFFAPFLIVWGAVVFFQSLLVVVDAMLLRKNRREDHRNAAQVMARLNEIELTQRALDQDQAFMAGLIHRDPVLLRVGIFGDYQPKQLEDAA